MDLGRGRRFLHRWEREQRGGEEARKEEERGGGSDWGIFPPPHHARRDGVAVFATELGIASLAAPCHVGPD